MSKTKVGLEVDIDTSQAKKGLQELNKTEVRAPVHIDTKDAKKEIQELSKTKVEIDLNFDPKKVKKAAEGATGDAFKRYQPRSKTAGGKMPAIAGGGGGGGSWTGMLAMTLGLWNNANQSVRSFEAQIQSATQSLKHLQEQSANLDKEIKELEDSGKAYTGKTLALKSGSEIRKIPERTEDFEELLRRRRKLGEVIGAKDEELETLNTEYNLAKEARFAGFKDIGKSLKETFSKVSQSVLSKLPGAGLLGNSTLGKLALGAGAGAAFLGASGIVAGGKLLYDTVQNKVAEGRPALDQMQNLNVALGTLSKNLTGFSDVQKLTDQIMLMGVQGVNSVENLSAAASTLMLAFEGNQSAVSSWLPYIDDMAAATGMSAEQMANLIAQSAEMEYVDSRLFTSISRQGIPIYEKLAEVLGTTTEKAKEMAKQGQISAQQFQAAFKSVAETVKGTSEALSSMTLAGAEASFKASGELEHAAWAEGYASEKIPFLNKLTEEQIANAQDAFYKVNAAGAGAAVASIENMWQSVVEWFDGVVEEIIVLPFPGSIKEAERTHFSGLSQSAVDKVLQAQKALGEATSQAEMRPYVEDMEKRAQEIRDILNPYSKLIKEGRGMDEAPALDDVTRKNLESTLSLLEKQIKNVKDSYRSLRSDATVRAIEKANAYDAEVARQKENQKEYEVMKQEKLYSEEAQGDSARDFKVRADFYAQAKYGSSMEGVQEKYNLLNNRYLAGYISEDEKKEFKELEQFLDMFNKDLEAVRKRELDIRKKLDDELEKEAEAKIVQEMQLARMFKDPNAEREWNEREMRGKLNAMEHIDEPMKEYFMEKWIEDQETRDYRKYAIAMGKNKYKGEEMLQEEIDDINKLTYLTQDERDKMIEAARARLMKEMQSTTEEGTLLGVNTLTGEKIYGTADAMSPKNKDEYIHNAWGTACRVITQFDTNWDQKQYDELQKSTKANVETAKGIQELNKKAIGPVVQ